MAWRFVCFVALLAWQQAAAPYRLDEVDVRPKLTHEVRPAYTGPAMRARIQGDVALSCVVLADGTVGDVRVTKSLDGTYGLDEQAIAAVKQWRFSPATKAGSPVPVVVSVNLSFVLKARPASPPTLAWPEGFDVPLDEAAKQAAWQEDTLEVLNLRIKISYPPGWTLVKGASEREIIGLRKTGGMAMLGISPPDPVTLSADRPLDPEQLQRAAAHMTETAAARGLKVESVGFGQAPAASHIWVWHAFKIPTMEATGMPAPAATAAAEAYDGGRVWTFYGTAGDHGFTIICITGIPRSTSESEKTTFVTSQAAVFGEILRRMSISVVQ
jgi:TonB family protein